LTPVMTIVLEGDWAFKDEADKAEQVIHLADASPPIKVALLEGGMQSGKASVAIGLDIGEGRYVIAETSLELFLSAARAFAVKTGQQVGE
jgi:hypothetical protein